MTIPLEKLRAQIAAEVRRPGALTTPFLVLVQCGSFSPVTYMHLRLFEMGDVPGYCVVGGFLSPVHDAYEKKGLVPAKHRLAMCAEATESSDWIDTSAWESSQPAWQSTISVLEEHLRAVRTAFPTLRIHVRLLCGSDLLASMQRAHVWPQREQMLRSFGLVCARIVLVVTRNVRTRCVLLRLGACFVHSVDAAKLLETDDFFRQHKSRIALVPQPVRNDISSTIVR